MDRLRSEVFAQTAKDITNFIRVTTKIESKFWKCQDSPWSTTSSTNVFRNHREEHDVFIDLHFPKISDVNEILKHLEHPNLVLNDELIHFDDLFSLNSELFIKPVAYSSRSGRKICEKSECQCKHVKRRVKYIKAPQYLIFHTDREDMKKRKGKKVAITGIYISDHFELTLADKSKKKYHFQNALCFDVDSYG